MIHLRYKIRVRFALKANIGSALGHVRLFAGQSCTPPKTKFMPICFLLDLHRYN